MRFRSQFEAYIAALLRKGGQQYAYEPLRIIYVKPAQQSHYTPDFYFPDFDFYIEAKGLFSARDRKKHLWIREQNPELDIRFVFQNASLPINRNSKTRCGDWAEKNGFLWAHKNPPPEWFDVAIAGRWQPQNKLQ